MKDADALAYCGYLAFRCPSLRELFRKHFADWNSEFSPHLWMSEVATYLTGTGVPTGEASEILNALEEGMESGDPSVDEIIFVSFIECLEPISGRVLVAPYKTLRENFDMVFGNI